MMIARALALAAAIGCNLSSATAAPILQFSDNMDGTVVLQVVTDAPGSLGAEVAVEVLTDPGLTLTDGQ